MMPGARPRSLSPLPPPPPPPLVPRGMQVPVAGEAAVVYFNRAKSRAGLGERPNIRLHYGFTLASGKWEKAARDKRGGNTREGPCVPWHGEGNRASGPTSAAQHRSPQVRRGGKKASFKKKKKKHCPRVWPTEGPEAYI